MGIGDRLREERTRLEHNQETFGQLAGVGKQAQLRYEKGERHPDSVYMAAIAAIGVDVLYVLTGQRTQPVESRLSKEQQQLLQDYEAAGQEGRKLIEGTARLAAQTGEAAAANRSTARKRA